MRPWSTAFWKRTVCWATSATPSWWWLSTPCRSRRPQGRARAGMLAPPRAKRPLPHPGSPLPWPGPLRPFTVIGAWPPRPASFRRHRAGSASPSAASCPMNPYPCRWLTSTPSRWKLPIPTTSRVVSWPGVLWSPMCAKATCRPWSRHCVPGARPSCLLLKSVPRLCWLRHRSRGLMPQGPQGSPPRPSRTQVLQDMLPLVRPALASVVARCASWCCPAT